MTTREKPSKDRALVEEAERTSGFFCPVGHWIAAVVADSPEFDGYCPEHGEEVLERDDRRPRHRWPGYVVGEYEE